MNKSKQWDAFLESNSDSVAGLSRISALLTNADRFDWFLQYGESDVSNSPMTLSSLTEMEWAFFQSFVSQYSTEWESYFHPLTYVGYFQEAKRRMWVPSTLPITDDDMKKPRVVIHFWAPWNIYDRKFDISFRPVVQRLQRMVTFRSMNVDLPSCTDAFTLDDVLNIPSLAFYNDGTRHHTTVGMRPTAEIEDEVRDWLANSNVKE